MPDNINIKSDDLAPVARGQAVVEARLTPEGENVRVLSVTAHAAAAPSEVFAGEIRYAGKVRFDCLVLADGKVECVSAVAEFSDKITDPAISAGMNPSIVTEVVNVEATKTEGAVKVVAVVDTVAFAVVHRDFACICEPDDGVYAEKREIDYCTALSEPSETAYITDVITGVKASAVLFSSSRAVVTGAECASDEVKVTGTVYTTVVARGDDELITSFKLTTPFVKSLSAPGINESHTAIAHVSVTESSATLAEDDGSATIDLAVTLALGATVVSRGSASVATDVFCADNEIEVSQLAAEVCSVEPTVTVMDSVDGQVALESDRLAADTVLCVANTFCTVSDSKIEDRRVFVDGIVGGDVVYYNAEKNAVDSIAFRLPFSMPINVNTSAENASVTAIVTNVAVKIRRESVFDVKTEVAFTARLTSTKQISVIENVKIGDAIPRPDATVIVHITKAGESLWQAAKALCCSPERVDEQNAARAPYSAGERLVNFCRR